MVSCEYNPWYASAAAITLDSNHDGLAHLARHCEEVVTGK